MMVSASIAMAVSLTTAGVEIRTPVNIRPDQTMPNKNYFILQCINMMNACAKHRIYDFYIYLSWIKKSIIFVR
jgi:hypothetical protein